MPTVAHVWFMFWIVVTSPTGEYGGDMYRYPDPVTCETARIMNEEINGEIPGFNISKECEAIYASKKEQEGGGQR